MADLTDFVLSTSVPPEVGRISREDGDQWTVTWLDGRVTSAKRGSNALRRVREDSLALRYAEAPEAFAAWFASDPVEAFVASLKDEAGDAKAAAIQQRLIALGLSGDEVKAAWTKHKKVIDRHPHVVAGAGRGLLRYSAVAQDPLGWIDALPLAEAIKALSAPRMPTEERSRIEARIQASPVEEWGPSEALLGWAAGLTPEVPDAGQASHIRLDDKSLQRVLAKAEADHSSDVLRLLARIPTSSKAVTAAFEQLAPVDRWELGHEALSVLEREAEQENVDSACSVLERLALGPASVPDEVPGQALRIRLGGRDASPRVDRALEAFLTATLVPLETLRGELASWDAVPREGLTRGELVVGSFRLRVLTALLTTKHEPVLGRPTTWAGLGLEAVEDLAQRQHPLVDVLLATDEAPGAQVARSWLRNQPANAATLGRVLAWSRRLRAAVPPPELYGLVAGVRSSDESVRDLIEDPALPAMRVQLQQQTEGSAAKMAKLAHERDEALADLESVGKRLDWAEARLKSTRTESEGHYLAQVRQAQIDAVRALASVLDRVFEADTGGQAWYAALASAETFGVLRIGQVGEVTDFDGAKHERVGDFGSGLVTVRRPGYEWTSDGERVVLIKAFVTAES